MTFSLNVNGEEIAGVSFESMEAYLQRLEEEDYIILIPDEPLEQSVFLQMKLEPNHGYRVEIRFEYEDETAFKQYSIDTLQMNEVEQWFAHYYQGVLPNLEQWNDITPYLKTYYYNAEIGLTKDEVHPSYGEHFQEGFYYSIAEYHAPFGNDTGFDMMNEVERFLQQEDDNTYYIIHLLDEDFIDAADEVELTRLSQTVISAGFCSVKVNGFMMRDIKELVDQALVKMNELHPHPNYVTMLADLQKVDIYDYGYE